MRQSVTAAVVRRGRAGLLRTTALQAAAVVVFVGPAFAQPAPMIAPEMLCVVDTGMPSDEA